MFQVDFQNSALLSLQHKRNTPGDAASLSSIPFDYNV
jgi:hypothetical protein